MRKRNPIFDNLRGICMLGVIAIHVGSMAVSAEAATPFLVLITNILSRYSVPTFFFISGYGLFYTHPLEEPFSYGRFLQKRLKSIALPYVVTSLLYICYYSFTSQNPNLLLPENVLFCLFFGTGVYHIYFLVILLWFYILFPLWRGMMRVLEKMGLKLGMAILFVLQVALYQFSFVFWSYPDWIADNPVLLNLCQYRLNYFPFFYLFVFMLGGVIARHYGAFDRLLTRHKLPIALFFGLSASFNTWLFYRWTNLWGMPYEDTVNYLQQLSLPGLVFTLACILFFSLLLKQGWYPCKTALRKMSDRSFLIYLVHPFFIDQLELVTNKLFGSLEHVSIALFYVIILFISYLFAVLWHRLHSSKAKAA